MTANKQFTALNAYHLLRTVRKEAIDLIGYKTSIYLVDELMRSIEWRNEKGANKFSRTKRSIHGAVSETMYNYLNSALLSSVPVSGRCLELMAFHASEIILANETANDIGAVLKSFMPWHIQQWLWSLNFEKFITLDNSLRFADAALDALGAKDDKNYCMAKYAEDLPLDATQALIRVFMTYTRAKPPQEFSQGVRELLKYEASARHYFMSHTGSTLITHPSKMPLHLEQGQLLEDSSLENFLFSPYRDTPEQVLANLEAGNCIPR